MSIMSAATATIIPPERFLRVSGNKVDAPIYRNTQTNIASIIASMFSGMAIEVVAITPVTGASASSIRKIIVLRICCLFFNITVTVFQNC